MGRVFGGIETELGHTHASEGQKGSRRTEQDQESQPGPPLRFPTRRRRLGLVEAGRERSLDDGVCGLGPLARARRGRGSQTGRVAQRRRIISTRNSSRRRTTTTCRRSCCTRWRQAARFEGRKRSSSRRLSTILWKNREKLNAYTRALLALTAHDFGKTNEARILIENLENGVKRDERPDDSVLIGGTNIQHPTSNTQHRT